MTNFLPRNFSELTGEQLAILKVTAVYYDAISLTTLSRCLFALNVKDGVRAIKSESLKTRIKPLLKLGLLQDSLKQGGVKCARNLAEIIARRMVDEDEFALYAEVVVKESAYGGGFYRYQGAEDCVREARIFFYRGDYAKMRHCLELQQRSLNKAPDLHDLYLTWFMNPVDVDWFRRRHPQLLGEITGLTAVHQILYLYRSDDLAKLQNDCLGEDGETDLPVFTLRAILELKMLRGEWSEIRALTLGCEEPELLAIGAALTFLQGDFSAAAVKFEAALLKLRKLTGQRNIYFYGLAGVFYPLAVLKSPGSTRVKIFSLLSQAVKLNSHWTNTYHFLLLYAQFAGGDLSKRELLFNFAFQPKISGGVRDNGAPESLHTAPMLQHLFLNVIRYWVNPAAVAKVPPVLQQLYKHAHVNGYAWLGAELGLLLRAIEPAKTAQWPAEFAADGWVGLAHLFVSPPDWELALNALANLPLADKKSETGGKGTRIVWLLSLSDDSRSVSIQPKEQRLAAKGGWSVGRAVALKRLAEETASFDYLTESDLRIVKHIKAYRDSGWYGRDVYYDFDVAAPEALAGHPNLYLADSPTVRVEVVKGSVELLVKRTGDKDKIKIVLEPKPDDESRFCFIKESPTRWRLVEFNPDHRRIYTILGPNGLETPMSAKDRVLQALTGIYGLLTVHSEISGEFAAARTVNADARPRMHLLPHGDGLRVSLLVRPFQDEGAYFQPGRGGAQLLAEVGGKPAQTHRDLRLEQRLAAAAVAACPVLAGREQDNNGDWLLDNPSDCLELLLQAQTLPEDELLLEWPEGVRFKVLGQSNGSGFSLRIKRDHDWFALQGELRLTEGSVLDMQQLLSLLDQGGGRFLQLGDGQFLALTEAFRQRLAELKLYADVNGKKLRLNPMAALALENWPDDCEIKADKHWWERMKLLQEARNFQPVLPSTFQAELRDYQWQGYQWLARLAFWGVGACLADDMGLGKTVQGLALLVDRAPRGPALIVAPTSVCMNWALEAQRFAPTLNPVLLAGGDRQKVLDGIGAFDVLICSYGLLQQEQMAEMLAAVSFATVILDEAQAIKNIATRRSQGAMNLQAEFKMIMTGTPLENHLGELWNLFRFINPGLLGSMEQFNKRFVTPIERDADMAARQQLKKLIQPFILRRTKTQVLQELPPRTEIPVYVELSPDEAHFYEALRRESLAALARDDAPKGQKHLQILAAITRLRRSCCSARLVKADVALPSSKLAAFGEIIDELLENRHKALVFSQFVDHLQLIKEYVEQRGISYQYLDGSTPVKERQQNVQAFQRGESDLFLISLKAGGVGLNLTAADYVIHMDPWWNPAVEDQASDRAHRIGQLRPVTIYRLIAKNTIEEKIVALHHQKRDLADILLDGADVSGKMSADDLLNLMRGEGI